MTPAERQAALRALAHLLLEASGIARQEAGDDRHSIQPCKIATTAKINAVMIA
jgi:hypothetical protein